ncbi:MAG: carbohydrate ABC transporter permease [Anaerolineae bacterium]|nr:carbohydrate ABC transporter permease [Anaerolineae bacterium]
MVESRTFLDRIVMSSIVFILGILGLACLLPFLNVVATSLSSYGAVAGHRVGIWPVGFHLENYRYIFVTDVQFLRACFISLLRVLFGVSLTLLVTVFTAFPFSQEREHLPGRTLLKVLMLVSMLFSGGLIPYYLSIRNLGLYDKFAVLIVPGSLNVFFVILAINFFRGLPSELAEAAVMDGATPLDLLFRVYLPLSTPSLATIALFSAVGHWNSWFDAILFLRTSTSWPVQAYAYNRLMASFQEQTDMASRLRAMYDVTPEGLACAFIVFMSAPIIMVYPLLQRYFVTGLTLGSVKS